MTNLCKDNVNKLKFIQQLSLMKPYAIMPRERNFLLVRLKSVARSAAHYDL